jgi:hypothetical protein
VLTHLGVEVGVNHGFVLGTTINRSTDMALEAGLVITLVYQ